MATNFHTDGCPCEACDQQVGPGAFTLITGLATGIVIVVVAEACRLATLAITTIHGAIQ